MKRQLSWGLVLCLGTSFGCGDLRKPINAGTDSDAGGNTSNEETREDVDASSSNNSSQGSSADASLVDASGLESSSATSGVSQSTSVTSTVSVDADGGTSSSQTTTSDGSETISLALSSPSFANGDALPSQYTCEGAPDGSGYSPELNWSNVPEGTKRFALVFKDTSLGGFLAYQWVAWDIPAEVTGIPEHLSAGDTPTELQGGRQFRTGQATENVFVGACPSWRATVCPDQARTTHNFEFILYAFNDDSLIYPERTEGEPYAIVLDQFFAANATAITRLTATSDAQPTTSTRACPFSYPDAGSDAGDAGDGGDAIDGGDAGDTTNTSEDVPDAGDTSVDSTETDAAVVIELDGAAPSDAATIPDASVAADASTVPDAAPALDAATALDAAPALDAGDGGS